MVQCVRNRVHVRGFMCGYWYAGFKCSSAALFRWVVGSVQRMKDCLFRTKWTDSNVVVCILCYKASVDRTRGGLLSLVWQPEINRLPALRWPSAVIRSQRGFFRHLTPPLSFTLYQTFVKVLFFFLLLCIHFINQERVKSSWTHLLAGIFQSLTPFQQIIWGAEGESIRESVI